jgi:hypothetical protein
MKYSNNTSNIICINTFTHLKILLNKLKDLSFSELCKLGLVSLFGIAILTNKIILQNPKEFYKPFIDELEVLSNQEVEHFFNISDHMKDI